MRSPIDYISNKYVWLSYVMKQLGCKGFLAYILQKFRDICFSSNYIHVFISKYSSFSLRCRPNTTDIKVFFQIFVEREYSCLDDIKDAGLIIDCGANVGYSSAYFLSRYTNAKVIAVEPSYDNFRVLTENLALFRDRVTALNTAIWSRPAPLVLMNDPDGDLGEWSIKVRECADDEKHDLISTDISSLLKESGYQRISILKIDIEGSESEIFISEYKNWINYVDNIVIELHGKKCENIFRSAISDLGFNVSRCGELTVCKRYYQDVTNENL